MTVRPRCSPHNSWIFIATWIRDETHVELHLRETFTVQWFHHPDEPLPCVMSPVVCPATSPWRALCCDWQKTTLTTATTMTCRNVKQSCGLHPGQLPWPELPVTRPWYFLAPSLNTPSTQHSNANAIQSSLAYTSKPSLVSHKYATTINYNHCC